MEFDWLEYEKKASARGFLQICGVDEAGRGPLFGSVYAAAVILPEDCVIEGLNDSKKLTAKKREELFEIIKNKAIAYGISYATAEEIDVVNILQATFIAMQRAVEALPVSADFALIDGNRIPMDLPIVAEAVVKGDAKSASIAAASILAKVSRDREMVELDKEYPQYGFSKHKGYPTKAHYEAIKAYGVLPEHRKTFLRNLSDKL